MHRGGPTGRHGRGMLACVPQAGCLCFDNIVIDTQAYRVRRGDREIRLGMREYELLCFFLRHPSQVFSRAQIIESVWPPGNALKPRTVDSYIVRLRRALTRDGDADPFRTVHAVGYALG